MRRQFLAVSVGGMAVFGPATAWADTPAAPLVAAAHGDRVSPTAVDLVETNIAGLRRLDDAGNSAYVLAATEQQLSLVTQVLKHNRYDGRTARRLHTALGNLAQLAGYVCQDVGDDPRGQRYFLTALRAAHSAEDRALGARILTCMSSMASRNGQPKEALVLIEAARRGAGGALTPSVRAMLAYKEARLHAKLGDEAACGHALNLAEQLLDTSRPEDEPSWIYWLLDSPESRMSAAAGNCYAALGGSHLGRAEHYLKRGIDTLAAKPGYLRDRAIDLPALAEVQRQRGELDAACATATEALTLSLETGTQGGLTALRSFRKQVSAHTGTPAVDDFLARARERAVV